MPKEASYLGLNSGDGKRDLFIAQKRPIYRAKEASYLGLNSGDEFANDGPALVTNFERGLARRHELRHWPREQVLGCQCRIRVSAILGLVPY